MGLHDFRLRVGGGIRMFSGERGALICICNISPSCLGKAQSWESSLEAGVCAVHAALWETTCPRVYNDSVWE